MAAAAQPDPAPRPQRPPSFPDAIPAELCARAQWLMWRYEWRDDKWTKVPYSAHTRVPADVRAPQLWADFRRALTACTTGFDGIGFALDAGDPATGRVGDPYTGVDLDHCRDPETGEIAAWAWEIVSVLASYTEITPSGDGLRVWVRGTLPPDGRVRKMPDGGKVELYDRGRFFTVTGRHLEGTPTTIEDRGEQLAALHARLFPPVDPRRPAPTQPAAVVGDDAEVVAWIRAHWKYGPLWDGNASRYGDDDSAADLALVNGLAYRVGSPDAARIDALFRQSGLLREKWDEQRGTATYGERTIALVLDTKESYWGQSAPPADITARQAQTQTGPGESHLATHGMDGEDGEIGDDPDADGAAESEELPAAAREQLADALAEVERLRREVARLRRENAALATAGWATLGAFLVSEAQRANLQRDAVRVHAEENRRLEVLRIEGSKLSTSDKALAIAASREIAVSRGRGECDGRGFAPTFRDRLARAAGISPATVSAGLQRLAAANVLKVEHVAAVNADGARFKQLVIAEGEGFADPRAVVPPPEPRNHGGRVDGVRRFKRAVCPRCGTVGEVRAVCDACHQTYPLDEVQYREVEAPADDAPEADVQEAPAQAGAGESQDAIHASDADDGSREGDDDGDLDDAVDAPEGRDGDPPPSVATLRVGQVATHGMNAGPAAHLHLVPLLALDDVGDDRDDDRDDALPAAPDGLGVRVAAGPPSPEPGTPPSDGPGRPDGPACIRCGMPKQVLRGGGYALSCACGSPPPGGGRTS